VQDPELVLFPQQNDGEKPASQGNHGAEAKEPETSPRTEERHRHWRTGSHHNGLRGRLTCRGRGGRRPLPDTATLSSFYGSRAERLRSVGGREEVWHSTGLEKEEREGYGEGGGVVSDVERRDIASQIVFFPRQKREKQHRDRRQRRTPKSGMGP
jgi:hypothetical protein